jgi:hypothetical protein
VENDMGVLVCRRDIIGLHIPPFKHLGQSFLDQRSAHARQGDPQLSLKEFDDRLVVDLMALAKGDATGATTVQYHLKKILDNMDDQKAAGVLKDLEIEISMLFEKFHDRLKIFESETMHTNYRDSYL